MDIIHTFQILIIGIAGPGWFLALRLTPRSIVILLLCFAISLLMITLMLLEISTRHNKK
jgi:hypothetical protein